MASHLERDRKFYQFHNEKESAPGPDYMKIILLRESSELILLELNSQELQEMFAELDDANKNVSLHINFLKTEIMVN